MPKQEYYSDSSSSNSNNASSSNLLKSVVFPIVLFASIATMTYNMHQLNPSYIRELTGSTLTGTSTTASTTSSNATTVKGSTSYWRALNYTTMLSDAVSEAYKSWGALVSVASSSSSSESSDNASTTISSSSTISTANTTTPKKQTAVPRMTRHESLLQLTRPYETPSCPAHLQPVPMVANAAADNDFTTRNIPRIIHMTGKTKCLTLPFYEAAQKWHFENHSFYFHDDVAVDELLLEKHWPMFPQLQQTVLCLQGAGGAAKADLWRYLALYEYGGIYTDMDNWPNALFNATSIPPDTDAYFLQEGGGFLSQYFFAVAPRHPIMFLAVHDVMRELHNCMDTGNFYVPVVSGPGATKRAFLHFMNLNATNGEQVAAMYSKPGPGHYQSPAYPGRSISVVSSRSNCNDFVIRSAVGGRRKSDGWRDMNITNYQGLNKVPNGKSCIRLLHDYYADLHQQHNAGTDHDNLNDPKDNSSSTSTSTITSRSSWKSEGHYLQELHRRF